MASVAMAAIGATGAGYALESILGAGELMSTRSARLSAGCEPMGGSGITSVIA